MKTNNDITIRLILMLLLALMLVSGSFALDISAVMLPLMIIFLWLVKTRLKVAFPRVLSKAHTLTITSYNIKPNFLVLQF